MFEVEVFVVEGSGSCIVSRLSQKVLKRVLSECVDKGRSKTRCRQKVNRNVDCTTPQDGGWGNDTNKANTGAQLGSGVQGGSNGPCIRRHS